jgi:hypothetical protein
VLVSTAKLQRARNRLPDALRTLEDYFRQVPGDDAADELRTKIKHELNAEIEQKKAAIKNGEAAGDYVKAWQASQDGLQLDENDLDFLLHAGIDGAMLRKPDPVAKLDKYLSLSQTPGADQKRRAEVYAYRTQVAKPTLPKAQGSPNWFSGFNNPPAPAYCPVSLTLNARIAEIKSRKQTSAFQWEGDRLLNIHTTSQDAMDRESSVFFEYSKETGAVRRVGAEALDKPKDDPLAPRFTEKGTAGPGNGIYLGLPNNAVVDPLMVKRFTGKPVATIVAGNPYFHPFVWTGVYTFIAEYDDQGRVVSARQIGGEPNVGTLDLKWNGVKLMEITQRGGDYKRSMIYTGDKLTEERISVRAKVSKIEYKYKGDQLVEANAEEDATTENRPRHVTFR